MSFFAQKVDLRSRGAMVSFLEGHYRYWTMSSVNRASSYAHCVKLGRLGLSSAQQDAAYELMSADENFFDQMQYLIDEFTDEHGGAYTIGSNGRSGGYLVLYQSQYKALDYKSRCRSCGQLNYRRVAPALAEGLETAVAKELLGSNMAWRDEVYLQQPSIAAHPESDELKLEWIRRLRKELQGATLDNRCGRCGAQDDKGRVNLTKPIVTLSTFPGRSLDQDADFSDWSLDDLRWRVRLVQSFDEAVDEIRGAFIDMLESCHVVEETVMVPKTVRRIECRAGA